MGGDPDRRRGPLLSPCDVMITLSSQTIPVLVVIGPSGSGKSSVVRALAARGVLRVHPTWTTRPRRAGERGRGACVEHRFVSDAEFDRLCRHGYFADVVRPFGLPYRYGLPAVRPSRSGPVDAVMLRAPFVERFEALVVGAPTSSRPLVYQIEDTGEHTVDRLVARRTGSDDVAARLRDNEVERTAGQRIAHRVFVNDGSLDELVDAVSTALRNDVGERS